MEKLFDDSMLPVCAPALIEQGLRSPADLARFPLIHYDFATSQHAPPTWADWFAATGFDGIDATRGLRVNVADHALDAAVAGAGVSLSHKLIASDDVHAGRLVTPFGPELPLASTYHFVCPKGHETRPNVRAFRDWLFAEMAETKAKWVALGVLPSSA
jgi:LysR family glycine cleavage system transcriptional activator